MKRILRIAAATLASLYLIMVIFDIVFGKVKSMKFYIAALFVAAFFIAYVIKKDKKE